MGLRRKLQLFAVDGFLEGLVYDLFQRFLPYGLCEAFADHRRWRFAWPETRQSHL